MVTKRQQLEWLAKNVTEWDSAFNFVIMSVMTVGDYAFPGEKIRHEITFSEWQQERDKMQKQGEKADSWHERGELPPVGVPVELWWGGSFAYNCELITRRGHHYVMWNLDADRPDCADYMNSEFRPLRTGREKAIYEMVSVILDYDGYMITSATAELVARQLYSAGYHK